jgi:CheY-like chemotaxis protein
MLNLALNARDAMPNGGTLKLATRHAATTELGRVNLKPAENSFAAITLTDSGKGMDPATMNRVFEPFFSTKQAGRHSGLGLATVYGLMLQNLGHVLVDSEVGGGTTFTLLFPQTDPVPTNQDDAEDASEVGSILVVEDNDDIRDLATRVLVAEGFKTVGARDGIEALEMVNGGLVVNLLLADIMMPHMGGVELARKFIEIRPEAKVLYISGHPFEELKFEDGQPARGRYLAKPFTPTQLRSAVDHAMSEQEGTEVLEEVPLGDDSPRGNE